MGVNDARNQAGVSAVWVAVLVAAGILLGGGVTYIIMNGGLNTKPREEVTPDQPLEGGQTETGEEQSKTDMELFQAALDGEISIRCEYTQDGYQSNAILRANGDIRINETSDEGTYHLINLLPTENEAYHWEKGSTQGFRYNPETYEQHFDEDEYDIFQPNTFERKVNNGTVSCEDAGTPAQDLFSEPEDINFTMPTNQL